MTINSSVIAIRGDFSTTVEMTKMRCPIRSGMTERERSAMTEKKWVGMTERDSGSSPE